MCTEAPFSYLRRLKFTYVVFFANVNLGCLKLETRQGVKKVSCGGV